MHTSHPLIRNSGITLFAVASLILSACSGMTQQEKSTAIDAGAGAIGDGV
jgi:outer membrane biogenesis lipoprotein LolB